MKIFIPPKGGFFVFNKVTEQTITTGTNGETMKKEGDYTNVESIVSQLSKYGVVEEFEGFDPNGNPNDSRILVLTVDHGTLNTQSYAVVVPAQRWRRVTEKDEHGEVIAVSHQEEDGVLQENELAVLMLDLNQDSTIVTDQERITADANIRHNLDPLTKTVGPETELNFSPVSDVADFEDVSSRVMVKAMIELMLNQREYGIDPPVADTTELLTKVIHLLEEVFTEAEENDLLINLAGTSPDLRIDELRSLKVGDPSKYAVYVDFLSHQLGAMMKENLHLVPTTTKQNWDKIAKENGFDGGLLQMLEDVDDLSHWLMNAGHISINVEADEVTGFISPNVLKHNSNLLIYFRNFIDGLCYSGSHTYEQPVTIDGKLVADARQVLRYVMTTAQPADYILPNQNLADLILTRMFAGKTNTADRAGLSTKVPGGELPNTHGDIRLRASLPYKKLLEILDAGKNNEEKPALNKTGSLRVEYTSRSATPDLIKYKQSVDIQEMLFKAANFATRDGYTDVLKWMVDVIGLDLDPESEYQTTLAHRLSEQNDALVGDFNMAKLNQLELVVNYVEERIKNEYNPTGHASTAGALEGIKALRSVSELRTEISKLSTGTEKFDFYKANNMGNWGEFENLLSDDDLEDILITLYPKVVNARDRSVGAQLVADQDQRRVEYNILQQRLRRYPEDAISRGKLLARLRHTYLKSQLYVVN